jgi:hypothetical protein
MTPHEILDAMYANYWSERERHGSTRDAAAQVMLDCIGTAALPLGHPQWTYDDGILKQIAAILPDWCKRSGRKTLSDREAILRWVQSRERPPPIPRPKLKAVG